MNVISGDETEDEMEEESIWESITRFVVSWISRQLSGSCRPPSLCVASYVAGGPKKHEAVDDEDSTTDDTINIFSLASGHLYERFLRFGVSQNLNDALLSIACW